MNRTSLVLASILASFTVAACSDSADTHSDGSGGTGGMATSVSASSTSGTSSSSGGAIQPAEGPIDAPKEQWTWVPFNNAFCANGKSTGIGVNLTDKSKRVLIYLQGGGACWNELTCYTFKFASHFDTGYAETEFSADVSGLLGAPGGFFDRATAGNPFKDYSYVFVPYCTGDIHGGSNVVTYGDKTAKHVGFQNMTAYLKRITKTFPGADRVFLSGSSAGGFGALANLWQTQQSFGGIRVDLIDDSGTPMPPGVGDAASAEAQRTQWNLAAALPPGCDECKTNLDALVGYYGKTFPDHRGALLSFTQDTVLSKFAQITTAQFEQGLETMTKAQIDPNPSLRYFLFKDMNHVLLTNPGLTTNNVTLSQWLTQMVTDDVAWTSQHP